jgi:hypothetical protein
MVQQITLPEPWSALRNDEDNFAVKSHIIYAAYGVVTERHLDREDEVILDS